MRLKKKRYVCFKSNISTSGNSLIYRPFKAIGNNFAPGRSHSIFTLILEQRNRNCDPDSAAADYYVTAKFHLVDLAGSERAKRLNLKSFSQERMK